LTIVYSDKLGRLTLGVAEIAFALLKFWVK